MVEGNAAVSKSHFVAADGRSSCVHRHVGLPIIPAAVSRPSVGRYGVMQKGNGLVFCLCNDSHCSTARFKSLNSFVCFLLIRGTEVAPMTESAVCGRYVVPIRKCVRPLEQLKSFVRIFVCL
jgi:hypothetical protein